MAAHDEARPFWDAAARGVLLLKRCVETGQPFHYPRDASPFTGGPTEWTEASGAGRVYSCSVLYRSAEPHCIAYVRLDEGPIILSNVLADDLAEVRIGQRVRAVFRDDGSGRSVPFFTPVG